MEKIVNHSPLILTVASYLSFHIDLLFLIFTFASYISFHIVLLCQSYLTFNEQENLYIFFIDTFRMIFNLIDHNFIKLIIFSKFIMHTKNAFYVFSFNGLSTQQKLKKKKKTWHYAVFEFECISFLALLYCRVLVV